MRVLLVNPPSFFEIIGNNPAVIEENRGHNPPLGLLLVAGYLQRESDHQVSILDTQAEELGYQETGACIREESPEVVGITTMTQTLIDVLRTIEIVKVEAPAAKVVLGGPHVHLFPDETIHLPGVDFLVLGEGEIAFKRLLDAMEDKEVLDGIPGLVFKRKGKVVRTGPPEIIRDLDSVPFPARHLTDVNLYDSVLSPRHPVTTMFTSRGCPYVCSFCDRPHLGKKFRARSAANVVDEMERCVGLGIREFLIYDDTFTVRRQRVMDICREIKRRGLDIGYDVRARVDTVDPPPPAYGIEIEVWDGDWQPWKEYVHERSSDRNLFFVPDEFPGDVGGRVRMWGIYGAHEAEIKTPWRYFEFRVTY